MSLRSASTTLVRLLLTTVLSVGALILRLYVRLLRRVVPMDWLGRAAVAFHHSPNPVSILGRDGRRTDLASICRAVTPPCRLNPLLFNGHAQTIWTATKRHGPKVFYRRRTFEADHRTYRGSFAVDFVVDPFDEVDKGLPPRTAYFTEAAWNALPSDDQRPMLLVLHGLSGGSHEIYLRYAIEPLLKGAREWDVCVVNSRGCAGSKITSGVLYNARATWDMRQVVKWARETFPNRPLFGLGFSLGANILTNYVAEEGEACQLQAAVVCANPFNLDVSSTLMFKDWFSRNVYLKVMGAAMKGLIQNHKEEIEKFTRLDYDRIQKITYLHEFDREVQCVTWGYPTEGAYYRDASSSDSILSIRIPFLAINARDDPIAVKQALPIEEFKQNPYTVLCTTSLGGHLAWFELGGGRWHAKPVCNFLNHMASKVRLDTLKPKVNGASTDGIEAGHHFDAMRRRMLILADGPSTPMSDST